MGVSLRSIRLPILWKPAITVSAFCRSASSSDTYPEEFKKSPFYRKSKLDWLFGEGYRRPLAADQGGTMRRGWLTYGFHPTDEYLDWKNAHAAAFGVMAILASGFLFYLIYKPDWPQMREWAFREAFLELERREKAGLPPISKDMIDPEKVKLVLPSDEELGDFEIVI
uniref:NADH dehydrogenase [ubiquinone] 1 beta subcomplex subunit 11, mitochondrial n=1 Tax=Trichuris muris TaxID=70415 RepID=A0A5S6QWN2_TRIMR